MGREAARVFVRFSCFVFLFPLCFAATPFEILERPGVVSPTGGYFYPPLGGVTPRGRRPVLGGGYAWKPPFWDFVGIFGCQWGQGPTDAQRPGPFVRGGGLLRAPSQALFTLHVLSRPRFFFFCSALGAPLDC